MRSSVSPSWKVAVSRWPVRLPSSNSIAASPCHFGTRNEKAFEKGLFTITKPPVPVIGFTWGTCKKGKVKPTKVQVRDKGGSKKQKTKETVEATAATYHGGVGELLHVSAHEVSGGAGLGKF